MSTTAEIESYTPSPKQALAHACGAKYTLYGGAMGGGKTAWLCAEGLQLSLDTPGNRGLLSRWENATFKKTTYLEFLKQLPMDLVVQHNRSEQFISLVNGSVIYYGGLKPSQQKQPYDKLKSLELGWFAIDECTEVPEEVFLILCGRLRRPELEPNIHYRGLLTCNPEPGWVRERFIQQTLRDHAFVRALPKDNPYLSPEYIEGLRRMYSADWVNRYLEGNWDLVSAPDYVFPFRFIITAMAREPRPLRRGELPLRRGALDVARYGDDKSVLATRVNDRIDIAHVCEHQDTMRTVGEVAVILEARGIREVTVDVIGIGSGVADRLKELGFRVYDYIAGAAPFNPKRFLNLRAESHWMLREGLEQGRFTLPDNPFVRSELSGIKYKIRSDKRIQVESKEEMRKRGLKSPDYADAVIMAAWLPMEARILEMAW